MATEFKLPELGENIDSGDLVRLMISPGASIAEGQAVMELETDKAVIEVPSSVSGTVGEVRVKEGDKLRVGQVIFTVENGAGAAATKKSEATTPPQTKAAQPAARPEPPPPTSAVAPGLKLPPRLRYLRLLRRKLPAPANSNFRNLGRIFLREIWFDF